jgi:hypothetical protein
MKISAVTFIAVTVPFLSAAVFGADAPAIRIVNCGDHVQSRKRGVCENHLSAEDFRALAPGVSWYYNWNTSTNDIPPAGVPMEYFPQAWGHGDGDPGNLDTWLAAHKDKLPRAVLALNEPNLKDQSFMPPQAAADLYKKIKAVADKYNIPVVGPNMSLGSPEGGSIKAIDPITKTETTYTFMIPYLKAFYFYMGDTPVPAAVYHTYGNIGELKWATGELYKQFNKPVWVTEFAFWNAGSPAESLKYLIQATDYFESNPNVAGYAFFKERAKNNTSNISLLKPDPAPPGELTPLGKAYVNMPVHDADLYYRLPGRLSAGSYVKVANSELEPTDDTGGKEAKDSDLGFDMSSTGPAQLYYNIQVDTAGTYKLRLRVSDTGKGIDVQEGDQVLGTTPRTASGWQTVETTVTLPAGPQVLHISTGGQSVNWIEFSK